MNTVSSPDMRKWKDGCWRSILCTEAETNDVRNKAMNLLERNKILVLSYLSEHGSPLSRAMLVAAREGYQHIWFSTNTSSRHSAQIQARHQANVYCFDQVTYEGIMLAGEVFEETDPLWRKKVWVDGYEKWYSGPDDPDFLILRFDVCQCNYYHNGMNVTYQV